MPAFLFAELPPAELHASRRAGSLTGDRLRLRNDDAAIPASSLVVIEAKRAARHGVEIEPAADAVHPNAYVARAIPLRFVYSLRRGYERQVSAGGVLVRGERDAAELALIRTMPRDAAQDGRGRHSGRWRPAGRLELPKGKIEPGESFEQAALREVREELGLRAPVRVRTPLAKNHYAFRAAGGRSIFKTVHYYLLACDELDPAFAPRREEGIVSVEWWPAHRAVKEIAFSNLRPVLARALELVQH